MNPEEDSHLSNQNLLIILKKKPFIHLRNEKGKTWKPFQSTRLPPSTNQPTNHQQHTTPLLPSPEMTINNWLKNTKVNKRHWGGSSGGNSNMEELLHSEGRLGGETSYNVLPWEKYFPFISTSIPQKETHFFHFKDNSFCWLLESKVKQK